MTKIATIIFSILLLGCMSAVHADGFEHFESYMLKNIEETDKYIKDYETNGIQSGLDIQQLYWLYGCRDEAASILTEYRKLRSCCDVCPSCGTVRIDVSPR